MTTALTIAVKRPKIDALSFIALQVRVQTSTASTSECKQFARVCSKKDKPMLRYAYARACYREGQDLTIAQVAMLCEVSIKSVMHYCARLKIAVSDRISAFDAGRVMFRIPD